MQTCNNKTQIRKKIFRGNNQHARAIGAADSFGKQAGQSSYNIKKNKHKHKTASFCNSSSEEHRPSKQRDIAIFHSTSRLSTRSRETRIIHITPVLKEQLTFRRQLIRRCRCIVHAHPKKAKPTFCQSSPHGGTKNNTQQTKKVHKNTDALIAKS